MSDEIPEDVMKAARVAVFEFETWVQTTQLPDNGNEASVKLAYTVARAILAERERAATKAEAVAQECRDFAMKAQRRQQKMASSAQAFVADRIAQAIRSSHD